ncbi:MAG TPA: hypothetical protein QGH28_01645, partial [Chloroflexota bacterium]|nr:hypothetical protein [Chloroflexota bacterium]
GPALGHGDDERGPPVHARQDVAIRPRSPSGGSRPKAAPISTLRDLVDRAIPPAPWAEGDNIPWDDPDFSERMLFAHLDQSHDLASRRAGLIDSQVAWIDDEVLGGDTARVLELACGPGLYLQRLSAWRSGATSALVSTSPRRLSRTPSTPPGPRSFPARTSAATSARPTSTADSTLYC